MSRSKRLDYAYAVGRVRALERYLIPEAIFREAAESQDFRSALKLIYDAGAYPEELIRINTSVDLDLFLIQEEARLKHLLEEILMEKDLLEALLLHGAPDKALLLAQRANYRFIIDYYRHLIDLVNIKVFFRARYMELPMVRLERALLSGGITPPRRFTESYTLPLAEVAERFRSTPYRQIWTRAIEELEAKETFIGLEREIENFLMSYLWPAKFIVFGPEPVFAFGLAKKKEMGLVRLLGLGKMLQIPVEWLKERLSATYV